MSLIFDQLPSAFVRLIPELAALTVPEEGRADCLSCHMIAPDGSPTSPIRFAVETRCCTYHPTLPNFLIGRALRRGGAGAEKLRARIATGAGVSAAGVLPSAAWLRAHFDRTEADFGRNVGLRCPYWVGGEHTCGIWQDRGSVCRTWFCRFDDGPRGQRFWRVVQALLDKAEGKLARWAVEQGGAPEDGDTAVWEAWYRECAARVDAIEDARVDALRDDLVERGVEALHEAAAALDAPVPERLAPTVGRVEDSDDDRVWLWGYSRFDARELPRTIFLLLAAMEGESTWREALARSQARGLELDAGGVADLHLAGILGDDLASPDLEAGGQRRHITLSGFSDDDPE